MPEVSSVPASVVMKHQYAAINVGALAAFRAFVVCSLHVYKDHFTKEKVRAKIQQAIGPHEDLLTIVKRRKLQWYCHVSRLSDLAKIILYGIVRGGRRQGRQRRRWENNIGE